MPSPARASWLNSPAGYGGLTKAFHWTAATLFAFQLLSGPVMTRMAEHGTALGLARDDWFNWHKTIGLVALAVAIGRLLARRAGTLPDWAECLSRFEHRLVHRLEGALYGAMFVLPVSGFVYVMAGGYGVLFAGAYPLPNPIGRVAWLAAIAQPVHLAAALALSVALIGHLGVVLRHTLWRREGLIRRML